MKKTIMAAIVAAFVLFAPHAFAITLGYCIGKSDGFYYDKYRNVPGGDAVKCSGGKTFNACEGNDGKGFRPKGGDFVGVCRRRLFRRRLFRWQLFWWWRFFRWRWFFRRWIGNRRYRRF